MYIWQHDNWPDFHWQAAGLLTPLATARHKQGVLLGRMRQLGFSLQQNTEWGATAEEILRTSEIEGEHLNPAEVRSSIARRLGLPDAALTLADRQVEGVVDMMLDAMRHHAMPLTADRLMSWQAALFPTGYAGLRRITVGGWRTDEQGPMQVVSGPIDRPQVHFQAPPATSLPAEMARFLDWFNHPPDLDGLLRSAMAHLWFVTVHPFEDGNGRLARAITDLALAQMENTGQRFYSLSSRIQADRNRYYQILERTQKGDLDITEWLAWFIQTFDQAMETALAKSQAVLRKAAYYQQVGEAPLSARQKAVLNRFMDGFQGHLTARKWASLAKCSVDTANRDIQDLLARGLLVRNPGGGKRTSYQVPGWQTEP